MVANACAMLGLDPLYVANEGKLVAFVRADEADAVLAAMRAHPLGTRAAIIGECVRPPGNGRRPYRARRDTGGRHTDR